MEDEIKDLMEECKKIYSETRGAYFVINCNDEGWKLQIPSTGILYKGKLKDILKSYIKEIQSEREQRPNPKNSHEPKKYQY
jgi:hypothetical protein